jgi:hypothetical protein
MQLTSITFYKEGLLTMPITNTNLDIAANAAQEINSVARIYGLSAPQVRRILTACVNSASARETFQSIIRQKAQAHWFSLVQPFEDSVVEFIPQEINRQRVRGKIRLPFVLSAHATNSNRNAEKSAPTNRQWSSGGCTYVTATLPVREQLTDDEYEVGVPVTVYLVRVRRRDSFNLNLKEVAGADTGADIWAQGITASVSRRGERFVTLLAQATVPQHVLDRFDVRCVEREEGNRAVIGISSLDGTSLREYVHAEFDAKSEVSSSSGSGTARVRAGAGNSVPALVSGIKQLLQFLNEASRTQLSTNLGGETIEYKLF